MFYLHAGRPQRLPGVRRAVATCGLVFFLALLAAAQSVAPSNRQLADPAVERKVDALLKQMTLEEKIGQLVQYNDSGYAAPASPADVDGAKMAANPKAAEHADSMQLAATGRMGSMLNTVGQDRTNAFQRAAVEKSRLHIPLLFGADIIHGFRTIYPQPLGLAASWNPFLVERLSHMSASEAVTAGVRWFYSPMVDVSRDARWGRVTESAGEDPYLGSIMAAAYVRGYQQNDLSKLDSVAACVKHYAAYGAAESGREYNTTDMSESRLRQVYLPPYKAAVEAGAATMMSSFNSLNGLPATANPYLMDTILRKQWGFNGFVVSDYTAVMELRNHGIALDAATATRKALTAGVEVDMMSHYYDTELPALVKSGKVPVAVVDEAVRRVLRVKFALGLFEHPYAEGKEVTAAVAEHRPLVREAAEESFVLLQNNAVNGKPVLPVAKDTKTLALIGPLADDDAQMVGSWSAGGRESEVVTLRKALEVRAKQLGSTLLYARGTDIDGSSEAGFAEAVAAAVKADVVIMALGESGEMSSEGGSRTNLDLPGNQQKLLAAIAATGKPIVLLAFSGRALSLSWEAAHIPAIMAVWFPGTEAGNAVANVLYGDVVPSGKLPVSFPRNVGQEPLYYAEFSTGRPPVGVDLTRFPQGEERFHSRYIDVPNDALFPFGHGLSYTTFEYKDVAVSRAELSLREVHGNKPLVIATATVTNTGGVEATEVVQCYIRDLGTSLAQPVRSLKGFTRVSLKPGEAKKISFRLGFDELSFFTNDGKAVMEPSEYTVWIGGSSTATDHANFTVTP